MGKRLRTWNEAMSLAHPLPKAANIRLPKTLVEMTMPVCMWGVTAWQQPR